MTLKRPVRPPALSALIIKLAASDDGESALARVMREISRLELASARVGGGGGGGGGSKEERDARL